MKFKFRESIIKIIIILFSGLIYFMYSIDIDMNLDLSHSFYENDLVSGLFIIIGFYMLITYYIHKRDKRGKIVSFVLGQLLSFLYTIGYNINKYNDLFNIENSSYIYIKLLCKWIGQSLIFSLIIFFLFHALSKIKLLSFDHLKAFPGRYRIICIIFIFIITWLPQIINNYPGVLLGDSYNQIYQALNMEPLSTHHPLIHTLIIKLSLYLGDTVEHGIFIYTCISLLIIVSILSIILNEMIENSFDIRVIISSLIIFLFYPPISMFSITMTKDMIFAAFVGLYIVSIFNLIKHLNFCFRYSFTFIIASLGVALFRKNGIYLVAFTTIVFIILKWQKKLKLLVTITSLFIILFNYVVEVPISASLGISKGSPREMLSLPIQQMARITKNIPDLDLSLKDEISFFFHEGSNIGDEYYPLISDNAKSCFSETNFEGNAKNFMLLAVRLLFKYPEESLEAYMCNSYGYWYPTPINWFYAKQKNMENVNYEIIIANHIYADLCEYVYYNNVKTAPVTSVFTSIGIIFWFYLFSLFFAIYKKNYMQVILFMPLIALWLTSIASPVWNEQRYVLSIYIALPIIIQLVISNDKIYWKIPQI